MSVSLYTYNHKFYYRSNSIGFTKGVLIKWIDRYTFPVSFRMIYRIFTVILFVYTEDRIKPNRNSYLTTFLKYIEYIKFQSIKCMFCFRILSMFEHKSRCSVVSLQFNLIKSIVELMTPSEQMQKKIISKIMICGYTDWGLNEIGM